MGVLLGESKVSFVGPSDGRGEGISLSAIMGMLDVEVLGMLEGPSDGEALGSSEAFDDGPLLGESFGIALEKLRE